MISKRFKLLLDCWNAYWFPESSGLSLAACRIIVVAAQLILFFPSLEKQLAFVQPFRGFIEPQLLIMMILKLLPIDAFPNATTLTIIFWTTVAAGITALIGLFTRSSAFLFALGNWILVAHKYSYGEDHHPEAILCIFLMALALSPSGRRLSIDAWLRRRRYGAEIRDSYRPSEKLLTAMWPLRLTQVLFCFVYVSTGLAKVIFAGLAWMNGYTLQHIIFGSAIRRDLAVGVWLAQQHTLCMLLSIAVILFETFFFLVLRFPKTLPYFIFGGVMLHLGILVAEGSPFLQYIVLYVVFVDFDKLSVRIRGAWERLPIVKKVEHGTASPGPISVA
jgi:uncharacterized membrane protein YphA (DoxX/SURF4 family)